MNFSEWRKFQQLRESKKDINDIIHEFLFYAKKFLNLKSIPKIILQRNKNFTKTINAFGTINSDSVIQIYIKDRQPMDILRTLSHELIHYQQQQRGVIGSDVAGSPTEDKANALAGEMLRKFGEKNPDYFKLKSIK